MANLVTQKQFNEVKNEKYTVISFENGYRVMTYSGCNILESMREVTVQGARGRVCLVIKDSDIPVGFKTYSYDIKDYEVLFEIVRNYKF